MAERTAHPDVGERVGLAGDLGRVVDEPVLRLGLVRAREVGDDDAVLGLEVVDLDAVVRLDEVDVAGEQRLASGLVVGDELHLDGVEVGKPLSGHRVGAVAVLVVVEPGPAVSLPGSPDSYDSNWNGPGTDRLGHRRAAPASTAAIQVGDGT